MFIQKTCTLVAAIALCATTYAQQKEKLNIEHATVFINGAELTSTASIKVPAGKSEILLTNVAGNINTKSLNVGTTNGVLIQSAIFQKNYLTENKVTPRAQELQDSIDYLTDIRNDIYYDQQVANQQINILNQNKDLYGEQTGVSVAELQKMLNLIKEQLKPLMKESTKKTNMLNKLDKRIGNMRQQQKEEMQREELPGGIVLVTFYSKKATTSQLTVSYVTPNAGWAPSYDLRVNSIDEPIDLTYKAHVQQSTGISWNKVALTLSGGNPNEGTQAPGIRPWYLSVYRPQPAANYKQPLVDAHKGSRTVTSEEIERMPTRNTTSMAYTAPGAYQEADGGGGLSISGGRGSGTLYYIDGVQVVGSRGVNLSQSSLDDYTTAGLQGINTRFEIDIPYTIPSDGKIHNVSIKNYQLPATYRYYTVPKIDNAVFLQAEVVNWQQYNLLSGNTSIFFDNTYIGQGLISMDNVTDTMYISLGRDKKIIVNREQNKERTTVKSLKANITKSYTYDITVRNTRKETAQIVVVDQIPVSNDNAIEIDDVNISGATLDKQKGITTWKLDVKANESKRLELNYTIKYPKGKRINNL